MNSVCRALFASCVLSLFAVSPAASSDAPATLPRPEHPFPQMVRAEWLNLNGAWEFAETNDVKDTSWLSNKAYPDKIIVPFCRESKLSGLGRIPFVKNVWYRRTFQKPADWKTDRVRLHIGACDWKTTVWVNGQQAGQHTGGSAAFCFDITDLMKTGDNTVVIHAFDETRSGLQPTGKQAHSEKSEGYCYTRTTGIWQTVWLEGVGSAFISDVRVEPDPAHSRVLLQAEVDGPCDGLTLKAVALADGKEVGAAEMPADWRNNRLVLDLSDKRLWSIETPFLYDLKLTLLRDGKPVDQVDSYFGLRDVTIRGAAVLINGKPVFQRTVLDQGFYPDGVWTAPSDEALKNDIKLSQAVGFNGARLHQKVFEPRFLYWADKLGYIVWGEFPNWGLNYKNANVNLPVIEEWTELVRRDRNHPSVVGWCPFNETCPEAAPLQNVVANLTRAIDPSRPVIDSSGWYHGLANPDVLDAHDYEADAGKYRVKWDEAFKSGTLDQKYRVASRSKGPVPFFISEYGGIGFNIGSGGFAYGDQPKDADAFFTRFKGSTDVLLDNPNMFGYCYTQLTDVEQEQNGLYTFDRKPKFDVKRLHAIQTRAAAYEKNPPLTQPQK